MSSSQITYLVDQAFVSGAKLIPVHFIISRNQILLGREQNLLRQDQELRLREDDLRGKVKILKQDKCSDKNMKYECALKKLVKSQSGHMEKPFADHW